MGLLIATLLLGLVGLTLLTTVALRPGVWSPQRPWRPRGDHLLAGGPRTHSPGQAG